VEQGRGWRLSACDVELARVRFLASEPVLDRTALEGAITSLNALAAELDAEPYRRMADLERARLARTAPVSARQAGAAPGSGRA
jgi:hypothetical protein